MRPNNISLFVVVGIVGFKCLKIYRVTQHITSMATHQENAQDTTTKLKPITKEEYESIDWDEYKATYTKKTLEKGSKTERMMKAQLTEQISDATEINGNVLTIDLDKVNKEHMAVEDFLNINPQETAEVLQRLTQRQTGQDRSFYVNIIGESENTKITENNVGKIISLTGYIEHITERISRKIRVPWFCQGGHSTVLEYRRGQEIDKPISCSNEECGGTPYKQAKSQTQAVRYGEEEFPFNTMIQQTVIKRESTQETMEQRIKGEWDKAHINKLEEGQNAEITGILRHKDSDEETREYYIHILGIEKEDKNEDLTDEDIREVREWVEDTNLEDRVMQIDNYSDDRFNPRLAVLCSTVKGNDTDNDNIHTLLIGPAGTGKTELAQNAINLVEDGEKVEIQKATDSGIAGAVVRQDMLGGESWIVKHGALAKADGSTVLVDELDKVERSSAINILSESMENQTSTIKKVASKTLDTDVSVIGTCNPVRDWARKGEKKDAIPDVFQDHILDRFDLILWMDKAEAEEREILRRFTNDEETEEQSEKFKNWVRLAKEKEPDYTRDCDGTKKLGECINKLRGSTSNRTETTLFNISQAIAKLNLHDEVRQDDVKQAWDLWTEYKNDIEGFDY
jgi:DNA replicative helicase MCM subunit Mcm2 (Cdc46/Mcm family)